MAEFTTTRSRPTMHATPREYLRHRPRSALARAGLTLACLLIASAGVARAACAPDPDTEGDGICDPVDNCVSVPNADQADTYGLSSGDGSGDACEPIGGELNVTKVKVRGGNPASATSKGKITVKGDFILLAGESFSPPQVAGRVVDGIALDQSTPAPMASPAACTVSTSGKSIKCKDTTPQSAVETSVSFKLSSASSAGPRVVKVSVKIAKLAIGGMAFSEPVTVTVTDLGSAISRVGVIHDCSANNGQLTCHEL